MCRKDKFFRDTTIALNLGDIKDTCVIRKNEANPTFVINYYCFDFKMCL